MIVQREAFRQAEEEHRRNMVMQQVRILIAFACWYVTPHAGLIIGCLCWARQAIVDTLMQQQVIHPQISEAVIGPVCTQFNLAASGTPNMINSHYLV